MSNGNQRNRGCTVRELGLAMNWVVQTPMSTDPLASHPMCPPDLAFRGRLSAQGWAREERTRFLLSTVTARADRVRKVA